ncbi:hypothetical protein GLOIN_2v1872036 [Rhizophagus clarus]|uniref:Uncharacterized protein n=1 Tax=Rhizophagus clarus TaxID=94130 RepID=A0A8H3R6T1_9GLOM|nr:hypothetical protein GLOIN_2v1872036 [Rhizophagus clarus]
MYFKPLAHRMRLFTADIDVLLCDVDVKKYSHRVWTKTTLTRSFQKQIQIIKSQGTDEDKEKATRLEKQFKAESKKSGLIDNFWMKRRNFMKRESMKVTACFYLVTDLSRGELQNDKYNKYIERSFVSNCISLKFVLSTIDIVAINNVSVNGLETTGSRNLISLPETSVTSSEVIPADRFLGADFDVVVNPRRAKSRTVNIEHETLEGLKDSIRKTYKPSALENDGAILSMLNVSETFAKCSYCSWQKTASSLLYSSKHLPIRLTNEPSRKCVNSMGLVTIRILVLTCILFFRVVADLSQVVVAVVKHLLAELKLRQSLLRLTWHMR